MNDTKAQTPGVTRRRKRRSSPANRYITKFSLGKGVKRSNSLSVPLRLPSHVSNNVTMSCPLDDSPKMFHWRYVEKDKSGYHISSSKESFAIQWLQQHEELCRREHYTVDEHQNRLPPFEKESSQNVQLPNFQQILDFCGISHL